MRDVVGGLFTTEEERGLLNSTKEENYVCEEVLERNGPAERKGNPSA